jgi:PIN domain nuclease of toxin-antitoxin system
MARSSDQVLLLDTHVWLWEVAGARQLRPSIRDMLNAAAKAGRLRLSVFSIWEIGMLASRGKIEFGKPTPSWIAEARTKSRVAIEPLSPEIAVESCYLPGGFRSDPADLIIVATARITGATLVTHDGPILDYAAAGHVKALAA